MQCLKCNNPVKTEKRANEYIAYCCGTEGWNGCCAEFGDTAKQAESNLAALGPEPIQREHEPPVKPLEPAEPDIVEPESDFKPSWER